MAVLCNNDVEKTTHRLYNALPYFFLIFVHIFIPVKNIRGRAGLNVARCGFIMILKTCSLYINTMELQCAHKTVQ